MKTFRQDIKWNSHVFKYKWCWYRLLYLIIYWIMNIRHMIITN